MAKFLQDQQVNQARGGLEPVVPSCIGPERTPRLSRPIVPYAVSSSASTARDIRIELEGAENRAPPMWYPPGGSVAGSGGGGHGSTASQGAAAQVNVLGAGSAPVGYAPAYPSHPIDQEVCRMMSKPLFFGQPHDYARFEAEWDELERAIRETSPYPPGDFALLVEFKSCLDDPTQIKLRVRMQQEPRLSLTTFKREVRSEFGVDSRKQHRRDWEAVVLQQTGPLGRPLTLQNWRHFEAQYKLHREQVPERSIAEEWRMLFVKLPPSLQEQIVREQAKRR